MLPPTEDRRQTDRVTTPTAPHALDSAAAAGLGPLTTGACDWLLYLAPAGCHDT